MNIGTVEGVLKLRDEFSREIAKVRGELDRLEKRTGAASKKTQGLTSTMKLLRAAVPIATLAAFARQLQQMVLAAGKFDSALNQSLAIMGDVSSALRDDMAAAAREMALQTTFSAEEAAQSYFFLASAGLDAKASIAALPEVARFAQAGMFDMALATDLLTDAQSALGLTIRNDAVANMENMVRVSDVLVRANTLANATVQQFSTSLTREAGAALKSFNIDVEEGVAVLAAFADQGVKGEQSGTGLSRILRLMTDAAVNNASAYKELGVQVFDASGSIRNLADIVADLEKALMGLSDEQRVAALEALGFQARVQGVILPLLGTSKAIREYEKELRAAGGTTKEVADKQLDSFEAQLKLTKNAIDDLKIAIGNDMLPALRDALATIRDIVFLVGVLRDELKGLVDDNPRLALFLEGLSRAAFGAGGDKLIRQFAEIIRKRRELTEGITEGTDALSDEEKVWKGIADLAIEGLEKRAKAETDAAAAAKKAAAEAAEAAKKAAEEAAELARQRAQKQEEWLAQLERSIRTMRRLRAEIQATFPEAVSGVQSFIEASGGVPPKMRQVGDAVSDFTAEASGGFGAMAQVWKDSWQDMVAFAIDSLGQVLDGTKSEAEAFKEVWTGLSATAGAAVGASFGSPQIGAAIGGLVGGLQAEFWAGVLGIGGSRGVAGQNVGVVDGVLQATIDRRRNQNGDLEALDGIITDMLDTVNSLFEDLGFGIGNLKGTFDIMLQDGEGIIVNINGIQKAFGEDMDAAIAFLVEQLIKSGDILGVTAEAAAAIKQASEEANGDLELFASDVRDIQAILEASGPIVPDAIAGLRDEMEEAQRLAEQAERFGLDASGVLGRMNDSIQDMADSFSRTALIASLPTGQGPQAVRDYFENVVRPAVFAFNALMREMGRPEDQIALRDIDAIQRGAVQGEQRRMREEQQAAFDRANESVQDTTRSFLDLAGQLDPFDEQLRRLEEDYNAAMSAAAEQGIATQDLTAAYDLATAAMEENRQAAEAEAKRQQAEARVQRRMQARSFRAGFFEFAAGVFEKVGDAEKAAELRAKAEFLNFLVQKEQQRLNIEILAAQGVNVELMRDLFSDLDSITREWSSADFRTGEDIVEAGETFRATVIDAADRFASAAPQSLLETLRDLLSPGGPGGTGSVVDQAIAPWQDFLDNLVNLTEQELLFIHDELIRQGILTPEELEDLAGVPLIDVIRDQLEEAFGPQMAAAIREALDNLLEPVSDFLDDVKRGEFGGTTPQQTLEESRRQFEEIVARIMAGDASAIGEFAGAGQNLLEIARQMFGSGAAFQAIRNFILEQGGMIEGLGVETFADPVVVASEERHEEWEESFTEMQQTNETLNRILYQLEGSHDESSRLMSAQDRKLGSIKDGIEQTARNQALVEAEVLRATTVQRERSRERAA